MTTLMIEITDEQAEALAQEAERLKLSVQDLAIRRLLAPATEKPAPEFEAAMDYVFQKNPELYRRLA